MDKNLADKASNSQARSFQYEVAPGGFTEQLQETRKLLAQQRSMVHDGQLPELKLLERELSMRGGNGIFQGDRDGDHFLLRMEKGQVVEAGVKREDGSTDTAHYKNGVVVREDLQNEAGATHRNYSPDKSNVLLSEEHERPQDNYADHLEFDGKGRLIASDVSDSDGVFHDQVNADGTGYQTMKTVSGLNTLKTRKDGSSVFVNDTPGGKVVRELDANHWVKSEDILDKRSGITLHREHQKDDSWTEVERRQT